MPDLFPPSVDDMIQCAERELGYRKRVYPRLIAAKQMTQDLADREIARMTAIADRLRRDKGEGRK